MFKNSLVWKLFKNYKIIKLQILILFVFLVIFTAGGFLCANEIEDQRLQLEAELMELEKQMEEDERQIRDLQAESTTFESAIAILNYQINKARLGIKARNITISRLGDNVKECSELIDEMGEIVESQKISLGELLRRVNEMDSANLVEIILGYDTLSEFFEDFNSFESIQKEIQFSLADIRETQKKTEEEKDLLEIRKSEETELRYLQEIEKQGSEKKEAEKKYLLNETKGEEVKYQKLLEEKRESAAEIRSRIFRLFGGGELHFEDALEIAQFAEQATGIRAAFILAVFAQESALDGVIGRNLGQCYYNTPANNKSGTVMRDSQKPSFLAIMKETGMNPNDTPVSCPIVSDGSHGGAMGPAQFMPRTWWDIDSHTGYKKRIEKITGNSPPSPFNNSDAFVGTALYLKDAYNSSGCKNYANDYDHILPYQYLRERCTAAKYYAGGNWWKHRLGYGDMVAERADKFQADIDIISQ